jgi:prepilin-type processing-associated H-X9-DG protein
MIHFRCFCGTALTAREELEGSRVTCPACALPLLVPSPLVHAYQELAPDREPARVSPQPVDPPQHERREVYRAIYALPSFWMGLLTCIGSVFVAIPAIWFGILARREIRQGQGKIRGRWLANCGIVFGIFGSIVPALLLWLTIRGINDSMEMERTRREAITNLKQLALAMRCFHDEHKHLPPPAIISPEGKPLLSWRVAILPYIGENELYKQFKLNEPWDSPHNIRLLPLMPGLYRQNRQTGADPHSTYYHIFTGPNTPFPTPGGRTTLGEFTDGTSNAILIVEGSQAVPWTKPADIEVGAGPLLPRISGLSPGGCNAVFADGSARFLSFSSVDEELLRMLVDPRDGAQLPADF